MATENLERFVSIDQGVEVNCERLLIRNSSPIMNLILAHWSGWRNLHLVGNHLVVMIPKANFTLKRKRVLSVDVSSIEFYIPSLTLAAGNSGEHEMVRNVLTMLWSELKSKSLALFNADVTKSA